MSYYIIYYYSETRVIHFSYCKNNKWQAKKKALPLVFNKN
jgi:hypothetical protein